MARLVNRLSALEVKRLKEPGWYPDGAGLYLQITPSGSKSWVYRYTMSGRERRHGLGPLREVTLEEARREAIECANLKRKGVDPLDHRRREVAANQSSGAQVATFGECSRRYIDSHRSGWRNLKHADQWQSTLDTYAHPVIGDMDVTAIEVGHVLKVLEPIWQERTETATRVRQRIESILDWARARGYRSGDNPARWRGHLDKLLPAPSKVRKIKHFEALPYAEVPAFYAWLSEKGTLASHCLAFVILTAARNGEARQASTTEIDLDNKLWSISGERMKSGRDHRVALSNDALRVLKAAEPYRVDDRIFPGRRRDTPISEAALLKLAKEYKPNLTVHGFRSAFRDWAAERTNFPREVAEAALAHSPRDKVEAAYLRSDLFEKRALMMEAWATYCLSPPGEVVAMRAVK